MSEHIEHTNRPNKGYEDSDVEVGQLFGFAAGVVGLVVFGVLISIVVFHFFVNHQSMGSPASPFSDVRGLPPEPRLQTHAPEELKAYLEAQRGEKGILNSYAWVDSQNGVVRIPIDQAMEMMLQKGYPVRSGTQAAEPAAKTAPPPAGAEVKH